MTTPQYDTCIAKAGGVTPDMLDCISAELKIQDERLNKYYKDSLSKLSASRQVALREAQRAWLKFRELNCGFYADPDGGQQAQLSSDECFLMATAGRAKELQDLLGML